MNARCACGYFREHHERDGRCPLCQCGKLPTEHVLTGTEPRCPGKGPGAAGKFPVLRRGSFRDPFSEPAIGDGVEQSALFPAPEHTSRTPWPTDVAVPRAVAMLQHRAESASCAVLLQYSRGHAMHATHGRPTSLCHHIGVRLRRGDGAAAYAVYRRPVAGAGSWTWSNIRTPGARMASITELTAWLTPKSP